jgi:hypothetical protein
LRNILPNGLLNPDYGRGTAGLLNPDYGRGTAGTLTAVYQAADVYAGELVTALGCRIQ